MFLTPSNILRHCEELSNLRPISSNLPTAQASATSLVILMRYSKHGAVGYVCISLGMTVWNMIASGCHFFFFRKRKSTKKNSWLLYFLLRFLLWPILCYPKIKRPQLIRLFTVCRCSFSFCHSAITQKISPSSR